MPLLTPKVMAPFALPFARRVVVPVVALVASLFAGSIAAAEEVVLRAEDLSAFEVSYTVGNDLLSAGSATLSLTEQDAGLWIYQLRTRPTGVFKLTGKGNIEETALLQFEEREEGFALLPRSYTYRQDDEKRRAVDATFDREDGKLIWSRRGETGEFELDEPVLDRLSVTLAVMSALRQGEERTEYQVFDSGRLKAVIFEDEGTETLDTSMGTLETVRVLRSNAEGSSRSTVTWFAPSLDFMPVKIEQYKRDDLVARLTLTTLKSAVTEIDDTLIEPEAPVAAD